MRTPLIDINKVVRGKLLSKIAERVLKVDAINDYYDSLVHYRDREFTVNALKMLNIRYNIASGSIGNIPEQGGAIVVSNHPTGALDGVILIDLLLSRRQDLKVLGNGLLSSIEPLKKYVINVDVFGGNTAPSAIKEAVGHVKSGGVLLVFPAAEVSTYYGNHTIEDKPWSRSSIKLLYNLKVPLVPVRIEAANSKLFHTLGRIHPILRTAQLAREFENKQNSRTALHIATPITPRIIAQFEDVEKFYRYVRTNIYTTGSHCETIAPKLKAEEHPIIEETDRKAVAGEVNDPTGSTLLFANGDYEVRLCKSTPNLLREIGRLREITFRSIGEGTGLPSDTDSFDNYYHQLIIWEKTTETIIGGYRVGLGETLLAHGGVNGFYCSTLFSIKGEFEKILPQTIELGRSFIRQEYQRKPLFLMLLWKGLLYTLLKNDHYNYLFGPVSISGDYSDVSKCLIMDYITKNHYAAERAKEIVPKEGTRTIKKYDCSAIYTGIPIEAVDKLVKDIDERTIPVLIKKYIGLGGQVIAFNVDKDFNNSLDAFLLLDLSNVPQNTLEMLSKELEINDVSKRFSGRKIQEQISPE